MENQKEALLYFEKSLSEHRDPEIIKKQKQLEKHLKEKERLSYINPEVAEQEKTKGNEFFKKGIKFLFISTCNSLIYILCNFVMLFLIFR